MEGKNAFLHDKLDREIYVNQPKGFKNVVGIISWYMQSPKNSHLDSAQRILIYVNVTFFFFFFTKEAKMVS